MVKVKVKFQIAPIGLKLGESDPPHGASQKNIWRRRSHGLKVKVKFQIAPIELKLGESDPDDRAGTKLILRRMSLKLL